MEEVHHFLDTGAGQAIQFGAGFAGAYSHHKLLSRIDSDYGERVPALSMAPSEDSSILAEDATPFIAGAAAGYAVSIAEEKELVGGSSDETSGSRPEQTPGPYTEALEDERFQEGLQTLLDERRENAQGAELEPQREDQEPRIPEQPSYDDLPEDLQGLE